MTLFNEVTTNTIQISQFNFEKQVASSWIGFTVTDWNLSVLFEILTANLKKDLLFVPHIFTRNGKPVLKGRRSWRAQSKVWFDSQYEQT